MSLTRGVFKFIGKTIGVVTGTLTYGLFEISGMMADVAGKKELSDGLKKVGKFAGDGLVNLGEGIGEITGTIAL